MKKELETMPEAKKRSLFIRLGILSGAVVATAIGISQHANAANDQKYYALFFKQGYQWCDARKLGKIFNTSPGRAKLIAGQKIAAGQLGLVQQAWDQGVAYFQKHGLRCGSGALKDTSMDRYAYNDVDRLVEAWKGPLKG